MNFLIPVTADTEQARKQLREFERSFSAYSKTSLAALNKLHRSSREVGQEITSLLPPLRGLGLAAGSVTLMLQKAVATLDQASRERIGLSYFARETKSSVQGIESLSIVAKQLGVNNFGSVFRTLSNNMLEISQSTERAGQIWRQLLDTPGVDGAKVFDQLYSISNLKNIEAQTKGLHELFSGLADDAARARVSMILFGNADAWRVYSDLGPRMLRELPPGVHVSEKVVADYLVASGVLKRHFENLGIIVFNEGAKPLGELQSNFADWLGEMREPIQNGFVDMLNEVVRSWREIRKFWDKIEPFRAWLNKNTGKIQGSGHAYPTPPPEFYERQEKTRKYLEDYLLKHHRKMGFEKGGAADQQLDAPQTEDEGQKWWKQFLRAVMEANGGGIIPVSMLGGFNAFGVQQANYAPGGPYGHTQPPSSYPPTGSPTYPPSGYPPSGQPPALPPTGTTPPGAPGTEGALGPRVPDYAGEYWQKAYGNYLFEAGLPGMGPASRYRGERDEFVDWEASRRGTPWEYQEPVLKGEGLTRWLADQVAAGKQEMDNLDTWLQHDPSGARTMEVFQAIAKGGRHPILKNPELIPPDILRQFLTAKVQEGPLAGQNLVKRMISEGWSPLEFARLRDALDRNPDLITDFIRKPGAKGLDELRRQIMQVPGTYGYQGTYDEYHNMRTIAENPLPQSKPQPPPTEPHEPGSNRIGAFPDQTGRPYAYGGTVTLGGMTFHYGTGGHGPGPQAKGSWSGWSLPFGAFDINFGIHSSIGGIAGLSAPDGSGPQSMYDPMLGHLRDGVQIHSGSGSTLDRLYTAGCFRIPQNEWGTFKAMLLDAARRNGALVLSVGRNGVAKIEPKRDFLSRGSADRPQRSEGGSADTGGKQEPSTDRIDGSLRDGMTGGERDKVDVTVTSPQGSGTKTSVETEGTFKDNETITRETVPVTDQ